MKSFGEFMQSASLVTEKKRRAPKKENLNFGDVVDQNTKHRTGRGGAVLDGYVYNWAEKKFAGRAKSYDITNLDKAISDQILIIDKPKGSMGTTTITIKPFGDYLLVTNSDGATTKKEYYKV